MFVSENTAERASNVVVFFLFSEWRWELILRFVDMGGTVDRHYLNFLFIIMLLLSMYRLRFVILDLLQW